MPQLVLEDESILLRERTGASVVWQRHREHGPLGNSGYAILKHSDVCANARVLDAAWRGTPFRLGMAAEASRSHCRYTVGMA